MLPTNFPEQNKTFIGPEGGDILPLPVYQDSKSITSCWQLSRRERLTAFLTGKIWVNVIGNMQPAIGLVPGNYFTRKPWLIACRHCYGNGFVPESASYKGADTNIRTSCPYCAGKGLNWLGKLMRKLKGKASKK